MAKTTDGDQQQDEVCASFLKAVADPLRLKVIRALQMGPLSVSDLSGLLEQEVGTVSHHLRVLFHAGIVTTRRDGKYIYYSLNPKVFNPKGKKSDAKLDFGCCRLDVGQE
jgi:DNA-binding transcriptional ArsR family regulator